MMQYIYMYIVRYRYVCVCVCVRVCMVAKKTLCTMDYGSTCLLRQHLGYDFGDRRTFSARIWIRQIYMHPYIHTYLHTYIHPPEHTVSSGYSGVHLGPFTDVHRIASAGCCGVCLGPSSCQTECQIRPQTERQNICQIECQNRYNARMNA